MKKRENIWKDALSRYIAVFQLIYSKFYQILGRFFQLDFFTSLSDWKYNEFIEEKNRNKREKVKPKKFEPFKNACIKMKEALVPFCDHPNEEIVS